MKSTVKLINGEEALKILSEQAPIGACIMQDGKFCYVNSFFSSATGYTVDQLTGKDSLEIVAPEDRDMVRDNTIKMLKGEIASPYQFRVICRDNGIIWVMATVKSIQYRGRQAILGNYMEITGRRQIEELLKDSEEKYRELADSISDIFFAMNEHLTYTYWNKASEILTGITAQDAIGRSLLEVFGDRLATRKAEKVYRNALKTQQPQTFVNDFDIGDRHYVFEISAYPSRCGISVFAKDITERKQIEEALRYREEHFKTLIENSSDAIAVVDSLGTVRYRSPNFGPIMGRDPADAVGRNIFSHVHPDDMALVADEFDHILKNPQHTVKIDVQAQHADGSWHTLEVLARNLLDHPVVSGIVVNFRDITDRRQAENRLREAEQEKTAFLEEAPVGIIHTDLDGRITYVNKRFQLESGYSQEEIIGKLGLQLGWFSPDTVEYFAQRMAARLSGSPAKHWETQFKCKDGRLIWIELEGKIISKLGTPAGFQIVAANITERKEAEEALRHSEERYRTMLEEMEEGYYEVDLKGNFTFVNDAMSRILGYSRDELIGLNYKTYTPAEAVKPIFEAYNRVYRTGEFLKWFPMPEIRKDGTRILAEDSVFPLRNEKEDVVGFRGISRDITERRRMEEALRQSEENYRTLFDNSVIGTIVLDAETMRIVMANQAAARLFEFDSVEEGIKLNPLYLIAAEDKERVINAITKELFEQDLRMTHEFRAITKRGARIWISATGARIMHEGKLAGLISFTDISEQRSHRDRLVMTDRLASLGEMASGAAHELNNPLTTIIGFSQLLLQKEVPDDIREDLKLINSEADRAADVTRNLLTFAGRHPPMQKLNQINNIIEDVLRLRVYDHKARGIEVERQLAPDLPEVMVDYFQMQQVVMNIIINAEYFMINAHNRGTLAITTKEENDTVMILFTDDGPGIPPENLGRIFDPFFTTKEAGKGTGLGLSICHGIVTEHGGQIYARSQLGKGATIVVELPAEDERRS